MEYGVCREIVEVLEKEDMGIVLLFTLYNLRSRGEEKCFILSRIISTCASTPKSSLLLLRGESESLLSDMIQVDRIKKTLEEWGVSVEENRKLYRTIVDAMKKISAMGVGEVLSEDDLVYAEGMRQKFLLVIIETYTDASSVDKEALEAAEEASLGAIRDPITLFNEQRGMLGYEAIKKLQTTNKPLYDLLNIFQVGTLEDYQSFLKSSTPPPSLNTEDLLRHIRLLSLLSLSSQGYKELPYQTIADKLQISKEDVESWVISAVSHGLITAKMDQLEEVVMVEKYLVRSFGFGTREWGELHKRLVEWKEHVRYVLDGLKECDDS